MATPDLQWPRPEMTDLPAHAAPMRTYPRLSEPHSVARPISFVTVHFCADLDHNLALSECVRDRANQLIVVDNRHNLFFDTLAAALEHGIAQARHELVAVVHEDVLLLPGWQPALERALAALEHHDRHWAFAGAAGWVREGTPRGHWSDPHGYSDHLHGAAFAEVDRIDEHLIVFRRDHRVRCDTALPSIHNIGRDLARAARACGRRTYVVNAPTIHKFANAEGKRILCREDSPKIMARKSLTYLADLACSGLYLERKWSSAGTERRAAESTVGRATSPARPDQARVQAPVVLLARGGGGSRLLSVLAMDAGLFLGKRLNASGDSLDMVHPVYGAVLARHRYQAAGLRPALLGMLRESAGSLLANSGAGAWGFKLPESLLILDEIVEAFPSARFVHLLRDPLDTCLRRTHMTARYDNQIGQAALRAAYRAQGRDLERLLTDSPAMHMAVTSLHQIGLALEWTRALPPERLLEIRFEEILRDPAAVLGRFRGWLESVQPPPVQTLHAPDAEHDDSGQVPAAPRILTAIEHKRATNPDVVYPPDVVRQVTDLLMPLRRHLGYLSPRCA